MSNVIIKHCLLTLDDEVLKTTDIYKRLLDFGFKIVSAAAPLKIEGGAMNHEKICELAEFLQKCKKPQEGEDFDINEKSEVFDQNVSGNLHATDDSARVWEGEEPKTDLNRDEGKSSNSPETCSSQNFSLSPAIDEDPRNAVLDSITSSFSQLSLTQDLGSKAIESEDGVMKHDKDESHNSAKSGEFTSLSISGHEPPTVDTKSCRMQNSATGTDKFSFDLKTTQKEYSDKPEKNNMLGQDEKDTVESGLPTSELMEKNITQLSRYEKPEIIQAGMKSSSDKGKGRIDDADLLTGFGTKNCDEIINAQDSEEQLSLVSQSTDMKDLAPESYENSERNSEPNTDKRGILSPEVEEESYIINQPDKMQENRDRNLGKQLKNTEVYGKLLDQKEKDLTKTIVPKPNFSEPFLRDENFGKTSEHDIVLQNSKIQRKLRLENDKQNCERYGMEVPRQQYKTIQGNDMEKIANQSEDKIHDPSQMKAKYHSGLMEYERNSNRSKTTENAFHMESMKSEAERNYEYSRDMSRKFSENQGMNMDDMENVKQGKLRQQQQQKSVSARATLTENPEISLQTQMEAYENNFEGKERKQHKLYTEDPKLKQNEDGKPRIIQTSIQSSTYRGNRRTVNVLHTKPESHKFDGKCQDCDRQYASDSQNIGTTKLSSTKYSSSSFKTNTSERQAMSFSEAGEVSTNKCRARQQVDRQEKLDQQPRIDKESRYNTRGHLSTNVSLAHSGLGNVNRSLSSEDEEAAQYGMAYGREKSSTLNESKEGNARSLRNTYYTESDDGQEEICLKLDRFYLALEYLDLSGKEDYIHITDKSDPITILIDMKLQGGKEFRNSIKKMKFARLPFQKECSQMADEIRKMWPKNVSVRDNELLIGGWNTEVEEIKKSVSKILGNQDKATSWLKQKSKRAPEKDQLLDRQERDTMTNARERDLQEGIRKNAAPEHVKQNLDARPKEQNSLPNRPMLSSSAKGSDEMKFKQNVKRREEMASFYKGRFSDLEIYIRKEDITKMEVDAVVNAANKHLVHAGGVARAISNAAGYILGKECREFLAQYDKLQVTGVFVSSGGKLPAKHVLHAVGPKWEAYEHKDQCEEDLRKTILRCLVEAAKRNASTLALPSISAAIFKVPQIICARNYMEAVKHFDEWKKRRQCSLTEIYFVDVNDDMVNCIREHFQKCWHMPCDCRPGAREADLDFAEQIFSSPSQQLQSKSESDRGPPRNSQPSERNQPARKCERYKIGSVVLDISDKRALDVKADVVVVLGRLFKNISGLHSFNISANFDNADLPFIKKKFHFGKLSKPDKSSQMLICEISLESSDAEHLKKSFEHMNTAFQQNKKQIADLVITSEFLGWGPKAKTGDKETRKLIGTFSSEVHQWLSEIAGSSHTVFSHLRNVTITATKDCHPVIQKVFESRKDVERISQNSSSGKGGSSVSSHSQDYGGHASRDVTDKSKSGHLHPRCLVCQKEKIGLVTSCCSVPRCFDCEISFRGVLCPLCRQPPNIIFGDQPDGRMDVTYIKASACGYERYGSWKITYFFPGNYSQVTYPDQGLWYEDFYMSAYVPAIHHGLTILQLLRIAFMRRLLFTFYHVADKKLALKWSDIEQKTSLLGGSHGYPDPGYLLRVGWQLKHKGVDLNYLTPEETSDLQMFCYQLNQSPFSH